MAGRQAPERDMMTSIDERLRRSTSEVLFALRETKAAGWVEVPVEGTEQP